MKQLQVGHIFPELRGRGHLSQLHPFTLLCECGGGGWPASQASTSLPAAVAVLPLPDLEIHVIFQRAPLPQMGVYLGACLVRRTPPHPELPISQAFQTFQSICVTRTRVIPVPDSVSLQDPNLYPGFPEHAPPGHPGIGKGSSPLTTCC